MATNPRPSRWCHGRSRGSASCCNTKNAPRRVRLRRSTWCVISCVRDPDTGMQPDMTDPCQYLDAIRVLALDAGRRILDVYEQGERDVEVTAKADGSPLTAADRAAHEVIAAGLKRLTPDIPLLSEEFAAADYETRARWTRFWLVDPLDGTKEFVSRNGEFTVNIALIEDGRPVLGVVYVPVPGFTYYACRGQGAHKHKEDAP